MYGIGKGIKRAHAYVDMHTSACNGAPSQIDSGVVGFLFVLGECVSPALDGGL